MTRAKETYRAAPRLLSLTTTCEPNAPDRVSVVAKVGGARADDRPIVTMTCGPTSPRWWSPGGGPLGRRLGHVAPALAAGGGLLPQTLSVKKQSANVCVVR